MTPAELPVSPPDITAILTSLGVFSLAIAAVVGGIYKGIKEVKKGGAETEGETKTAVLIETASARQLSESNLLIVETHRELISVIRSFERKADNLIEALRDNREMARSQIEEQHRLRAATVDLVEMLRRVR